MALKPLSNRLTLMLVVAALVMPIAVGGGVVWYVVTRPVKTEKKVRLSVRPPAKVFEGEAFDLTVTVFNDTPDTVTLEGIDLGVGYLAGFVLIRAEPSYRDEDEGPAFRRFGYGQTLPPGGSAAVVFRLQAVTAGTYQGDIDARLSGAAHLLTQPVQTVVAAGGAPSTGGTGRGGGDDGPPLIIRPPDEPEPTQE